jgi:hypothetical protein
MSLLLDHLWQSTVVLWQSTVVLAVIGLLTVFFRKNGAHVRHALWTVASLKFLLPFACLTAVGGFVSHLFSSPPPALPVLTTFQGAAQPFSYSTTFAAATSTRMNWLPLLVAAWGVGFLTVCCIWLVRWQKLRSMVRAAREAEMAAPMKVKISSGQLEAGLIGIVHPVLLLPEGIAEKTVGRRAGGNRRSRSLSHASPRQSLRRAAYARRGSVLVLATGLVAWRAHDHGA